MGGKDSEVLLKLVAEVTKDMGYDKVNVICVNTGLEYISVNTFAKTFTEKTAKDLGIEIDFQYLYPEISFIEVLKKYGYPVISKDVSSCIESVRKGNTDSARAFKLGLTTSKQYDVGVKFTHFKYKYLLNAPFRISDKCCGYLKKTPIHLFYKKTGLHSIVGTMAEESPTRLAKWTQNGCNSFNSKYPNSSPLSFWTEQDILRYIYINNLGIAEPYGEIIPDDLGATLFENEIDDREFSLSKQSRTGCVYCLFGIHRNVDRLTQLKSIEPKRYKFIMGGGEFDNSGMWIPNKQGLGYKFVVDWLNENGNLKIQY